MAVKKLSNLKVSLLFFILFSIITFFDFGTMVNRTMRLLPNLAAIGILYFAYTPKIHKDSLQFLFFLLASAITAFFYENPIFGILTLVFSTIAYSIVGISAIKQLSKLKASWFLRVYFFITLLVLGYFLFELTQLSKDQYDSYLQFILFNIGNLAIIFMLAGALLLVHQNPNQVAMVFLAFVIILILSEISRAASYYSKTSVALFIYGSKVLYILALTLLINCCGLIERQFVLKN
ncbi:MAG: hypothetical protein R2781_05835 [Flavobacteriaceae bacterium]